MSSLTIRDLEDGLERRLRVRAAEQNRSMEEEARDILRCALAAAGPAPTNLAVAIRRRVEAAGGGVELELPPRGPMRDPPDFR
ncbi:MAG TPA: plasmid stabilization protein [Stellaceae bacterium]|jgi:plasmid stability protein|nr:plasmid stabilization protein [Stellaceae bacterium]